MHVELHSPGPSPPLHSFLQKDVLMVGILCYIHSLILVFGTYSADEKMEDKSESFFLLFFIYGACVLK